MDTEKYLLPSERKRLDEALKMPKNKAEVLKMIKDAPKTKASESDLNNLYKKIEGKLSGPLEELMYDEDYGVAYGAGYSGDDAPKNPFKKNTLAYWIFDGLYKQGKSDR